MLATNRAKSLVTLVQRVLEGLERQRDAMVAAAAARSSELDKVNQLLLDVPLVLSSTSFLPGGENAPQELIHIEEGEVGDDGEVEDDGEGSSTSHDMDVDSGESGEVKPAARDPYGMIEVSSLLAERERLDETGGNIGSGFGIQSIESDAAVIARSLMPPRASRTSTKRRIRDLTEEDEEEDIKVEVMELL